MRKLTSIILALAFGIHSGAQQSNCILQRPSITIHFGSGQVTDRSNVVSARYTRITGYCPSDGYYTYTPYTSGCFRGDWFTLDEDHTPGDKDGNMLLINSSPRTGIFLATSVNGLKSNTTYQFAVWMMNVCKITEKCPFPLLPDISIQLQTREGKNVAQLSIGEVARVHSPKWTQYEFMFTTPASNAGLNLVMVNNMPGGCGNDFVLDDITFRECVPPPPPPTAQKKNSQLKKKQLTVKKTQPKAESKPVAKKAAPNPAPKPIAKKTNASTKNPVKKPVSKPIAKSTVKTPKPLKKVGSAVETAKPTLDSIHHVSPQVKQRTFAFPPAPSILRTRTNTLVKQIMTTAGEIRIDLYDNGEIDDDTVTIYHNNTLLKRRVRLSQKPITFRIVVNEGNPHHEIIMVADNLGSIPPNTSLMIVTAGDKRNEVFISSTKQKNAKVVLDLEE